jgi:hypothetical protein
MFRKALKYYIVGLLVVLIGGIALFEFACRSVTERHFPGFSTTKESSISDGFYVSSYLPENVNYIVPNRRDTISFDTAWLEHNWKVVERFGLCLLEHKVKNNDFHFSVPLMTTASHDSGYRFTMKPLSQSSYLLYTEGEFFQNSFITDFPTVQDTIKVIVSNTASDTSLSTSFSDTLSFIRLKNGR